ncbi:aldo/keto reductase [Alloscardovia theropitheci]|uniref:Aldo/keto reductase n=1 Tax=Alloscardovia theropitheci TaxID=2496842 RepID=A0A4R0QUT9_9BIFI|nr:aldo/keto reductase [Alloscardovia theropitheci]TCD53827.1 aldo/keto reductase [Alloscardovia theropitheci]
MKYIPVGTTDIKASAIAQGVMRMADKTREESAQVVSAALESGINFFDTADVYTDGESSRKLGQSLQDLSVDRSSIYVQTKVGIVTSKETGKITRYDFSKKRILDRVDFELQNLQTDYVDFLLLHRPDTLMEPDEVNEAFALLKESGKVRYFGVSNMSSWQVEFLQNNIDEKLHINQLQMSLAHTGMVDQTLFTNMKDSRSLDYDGGLMDYSRLRHMTIQAWSPVQKGFFGGVFIDDPEYAELNRVLDELGSKYGVSKNAVAAAWLLRHPSTMQVIIGTMNSGRIAEFASGADVVLTHDEWYQLYAAAGNMLP